MLLSNASVELAHEQNYYNTCMTRLLVKRLGVGGGGSDVGIAGSLVGAGGELEGLGSGQVGVAGGGVHSCVLVEVEVRKLGEHAKMCGESMTSTDVSEF